MESKYLLSIFYLYACLRALFLELLIQTILQLI